MSSHGFFSYLQFFSKESSNAVNLSRDITKASEIDGNLLTKLENEGTISTAGRSGGKTPLEGTANSYLKTDGGHTLVYDSEGRLIYDISSERVKMFVWIRLLMVICILEI